MDEPKVNYEKLLEAALNKMKSMLDNEREYFQCLYSVGSYSEDITLVTSHLMEMDMADQLALLRLGIIQGETCRKLKAKYGFEKEGKEEI